MRKMYHIKKPDQLRELSQTVKSGSVSALLSVWNTKLRKDGKSPWDQTIFAIFETGDDRRAYIGRKTTDEIKINAYLKYNSALQYCKGNLELIWPDTMDYVISDLDPMQKQMNRIENAGNYEARHQKEGVEEMKKVIKCSECDQKEFVDGNGNPNRYYCIHPNARFARSECEPTPMICRTERYSTELTIKTSPKWCPRKVEK